MTKVQSLLALFAWIILCNVALFQSASAQCVAGEVEITIAITTDLYGYEAYWELVPDGDGCQDNSGTTIFAGGNLAEITCGGGGAQVATAGNGYGNSMTITEGPWCLIDGDDYNIEYVDDFGDGGASFAIYGDGIFFDNVSYPSGSTITTGSHAFTAQVGIGIPNDTCTGAIDIVCGTDTTGTTVGATIETPAAGSCGAGGATAPSVWYHFVGNGDAVELSLCNAGTDYDTRISVYQGTCGALTCVAGNDDGPANPGPCNVAGGAGGNFVSLVNFNSVIGTDYYIMIHGYDPGGAPESGNFQMTVTCTTVCAPLPPNDDCAAATAISLAPAGTCGATTGTNVCATAATANPACDPFGIIADVWYTFNSGSNTDLTITFDSVTAPLINWALYDTCGNADLFCSNGYGSVALSGFDTSTTYYLQVWNSGGAQAGDFDLCIEEPVPFDGEMTAFGFPSEYSIMPITQTGPWDMIGQVRNTGGNPITNVVMNIDITKNGTSVYTDMSTPVDTLFPNQDTILVLTNQFTPYDTGVYNIEYLVSIAEADGNLFNDTINFLMVVSDTVYGRDLLSDGSLGVGAGAMATLGNLYEVFNDADLKSISAEINAALIGDTTRFVLYDVIAGLPTNLLAASAEHIFTAADTGGVFLTLQLAGGAQALTPGTYFVGVEEYTSTPNLGIGTSDFIYSVGQALGNIDGAPFDSLENLGNFSVTMVVRANLVPPCFTSATDSITNASCWGVADGAIDITPAGGTVYSYAWSNGATTEDQTGLAAGSYSVSVSDTTCVSYVGNFTIAQPAEITFTTSSTPESCGLADGSATAMAAGGAGGFTYLWDAMAGAQTTSTATGLGAATYLLTATDTTGCSRDTSVMVTGTVAVTLDMDTTAATCNLANGSAMATVLTGQTPFTYAWSNGQTSAMATGLAAGTYSVTVTDANTCSATADVLVGDTQGLTMTGSPTLSSCGQADGTATVTPTAGVSPYTYAWDAAAASQTTATATGLSAGIYGVTATAANNCTSTLTITVNDLTTLVATTDTTDASCGLPNGDATVTASAGFSPYTYMWGVAAGSQTTATATGLAAGNYTVSVTDSAGCVLPLSVTVAGTVAVTVANSETPENCGNNDGTATVTVLTGTSPYLYAWDNGQTTATATGLAPGGYSVTVTDTNGCEAIGFSSVVGAGAPTATITGVVQVSCNGGADGSIAVAIAGGVLPYSFDWTDNGDTTNTSTTSTAGSLMAGIYTFTGTDSVGCAVVVTDTIVEPTAVAAVATGTNPQCAGGSNGSAMVVASGGTSPYTYAWASGSTTTTQGNLSAGSETVTVTDANQCPGTALVTLTDPAAMTVTVSTTNITCNGLTDGTATANVVQGTTPFTYLWTGGATTNPITGLSVGMKSCTVTDANGCTASGSGIVGQPQALNIGAVAVDVSCNGDTDGQLAASAAGGVQPFTYAWTGGLTGSPVLNVAPGIYMLTATDANGCTGTASATVGEPAVLVVTVDVVTDESSVGAGDGSVEITAAGGTGAYTYVWSDASTNEDLASATAGNYTVTVTDANGCTETASAAVASEVGIGEIATTVNMTVVPNPNNGQFALRFNLEKNERLQLTMRNSLGQVVHSEAISADQGSTTNLSLSHLNKGVYFLQVRNDNMETIRKIVIQ